MIGLIRKATLLGVCGLLAASTASAAVPSAAMSSVEGRQATGVNSFVVDNAALSGARLTGEGPANPAPSASAAVDNPDPLGRLAIHVRDFSGAAIPGSHVTLDFNWPGSPCVDSRLCLTPVAGQTLVCAGGLKQISATTNPSGDAVIYTLGASYNTGLSTGNIGPSAPSNCLKVLADGVELALLKVAIFDQDGAVAGNGVNGVDVNIMGKANVARLGGAPYLPRHDLNLDGFVTGPDVNFESQRNLEASPGQQKGSFSGCPAGTPAGYCPL